MKSGLRGTAGVTVIFAVLVGGAGGVGTYTFIYADGGSYLRDDPSACANCHIMSANFDGWTKSTHRPVATCNDCHAPHSSLAAKLWVKGRNGFNHSVAFTSGRFHEPIRITASNRRVTEAACRYCHGEIVSSIDPIAHDEDAVRCIRCHAEVGHR